MRANGIPTALITDSVFSMEGDVVAWPGIKRQLTERCGTSLPLVMFDDAHGTGVLGDSGAGVLEQYPEWKEDIKVLMGTLSKALGSQGGYICGSRSLIELLINHSRAFIFSTGIAPAAAAGALAAVRLLQRSGKALVEELRGHIGFFRAQLKEIGLSRDSCPTPIVSVLLGENQRALDWSERLREEGFLVPAIRPPTVAPNTARLRITLHRQHTRAELQRLLDVLEKTKKSEG